MKMKKLLFIIAIAIYVLPVIVLAHPGGTDGSGGHWNHKTGEYHYHHGYPEHQHDPDCPYDYKDKTGQSSGRSYKSSSSTSATSYSSYSSSSSTQSKTVKSSSGYEGSKAGALIGIGCVAGAVVLAVKNDK